MAIAGVVKNLHHKHNFKISIDGFKDGSFAECSEISAEVKKVEYRGGGEVLANKSPGNVEVADITLKRGVMDDFDMYTWFATVVQMSAAGVGSAAIGLASPYYKRNVDVAQLDRDGSTLRRWTLFGAWPVKFIAGAWDAKADEVVIEEMVLAYDFFDLAV